MPTSSTASSGGASTGASSSSPPAAYTGPPVISTGNANFTYYNCVAEPSAGRLLASQVDNNGTAMTIERCLGECWRHAYAGVEYGRECWCGDALNVVGNPGATPAANLTEAKAGEYCGFVCPGNGSEFCGGSGVLSLFWFDSVKAHGDSKGAGSK